MKHAAKIMLLVLIGIVLGMGIAECAIRIFHLSSELQYEPNPYYGWGHTPNSEILKHQPEGMVNVVTNSAGLRDEEHQYVKPHDVFRILVLGDSFAEAIQVPLQNSFPRLLQGLSNAKGIVGRLPVEVINSGTSGYGTDNELLFFRWEGKKYAPDVVILELCLCNDIRNNWYKLENVVVGGFKKPYFVPGADGDGLILQRFPFYREATLFAPVRSWLNRHVRLYPFLRESRDRLMAASGGASSAIPLDYQLYLKESSEEWDIAWHVTHGLLRELHRDVVASGARLFVMVVPTRFQVRSQDWRQVLETYGDMKNHEWEIDKPNRLLRQMLERERIDYVDLLSPFRKYTNQSDSSLYLASDGHWNREGHRLASQIIFEELTQRGMMAARTALETNQANSEGR